MFPFILSNAQIENAHKNSLMETHLMALSVQLNQQHEDLNYSCSEKNVTVLAVKHIIALIFFFFKLTAVPVRTSLVYSKSLCLQLNGGNF